METKLMLSWWMAAAAWYGLALVVILQGWRILNWVWVRPRKLEKFLRQQGVKGTKYKLFYGDLKEMVEMTKEAKSKPIAALSHDILPRVLPFHQKHFTTFGRIFFTWMGPKLTLHVMEPDLIREVFAKNYQFQKPSGGNPLMKLMARGVVNYDGDKWVKHRKIINPAFHAEKLKYMLPAFLSSCQELIGSWEDMLQQESSREVDVFLGLQTLTSDVISRTAFGSCYEEGRRVFELQKELAELIVKASQSIYLPGMRFLPTKMNRRMKEIDKEVKASIRSIIDRRLKAMNAGEGSNEDLLGILLESNQKEIQEEGNSKLGMTIQDVIEECKLFYVAGQETTSNLLVWTMILLSHHTDWQSRAREEVLQVFGSDCEPSLDGLNHLKIVTIIFYEVLRLYPAAVFLARMIHEETKIRELVLPAGTTLELQAIHLHHDPELWGEDANEFKPERFSEGVSKATKGQLSYFPFGSGPRICIGQNFAMLEAKLAMAMILQRFSFQLPPSYCHAPHTIITLQPQYGAPLILRKLSC